MIANLDISQLLVHFYYFPFEVLYNREYANFVPLIVSLVANFSAQILHSVILSIALS